MTTKEPVLLVMSILSGLTIFWGGAGGITLLTGNDTWATICALGTLATGAATAGVQFWVRGQVTPTAEPRHAQTGGSATGTGTGAA